MPLFTVRLCALFCPISASSALTNTESPSIQPLDLLAINHLQLSLASSPHRQRQAVALFIFHLPGAFSSTASFCLLTSPSIAPCRLIRHLQQPHLLMRMAKLLRQDEATASLSNHRLPTTLRPPQSMFNAILTTVDVHLTIGRFIRSQELLEADAREALPYVRKPIQTRRGIGAAAAVCQ